MCPACSNKTLQLISCCGAAQRQGGLFPNVFLIRFRFPSVVYEPCLRKWTMLLPTTVRGALSVRTSLRLRPLTSLCESLWPPPSRRSSMLGVGPFLRQGTSTLTTRQEPGGMPHRQRLILSHSFSLDNKTNVSTLGFWAATGRKQGLTIAIDIMRR